MQTAIEEEYWTPQYKTDVLGRGKIFWPEDGNGKYDSSEDAEQAASGWLSRGYSEVRVMHVTRRVEYGQPIVASDE